VLKGLPKGFDENLLIGYESSDDAAVYKLSDEIAVVLTLDFFTPVVEDAYTFGKIAAANALSDVYAMGAEVKSALNIVAFPEKEMDTRILGEILRGGAEKVHEAGGVLSGGHSIGDSEPIYGLSVMGVVHPDKILPNNGCKMGDKVILTKPLGVGVIMSAHRMNAASDESYQAAIKSMETLNKYAADIMRKYNVNACTDVTGFGFLGHLGEMIGEGSRGLAAVVYADKVPVMPGALLLAKEFYITGSAQKNANFMKMRVNMGGIGFELKEILYDPQTSGGLLISVSAKDADKLLNEMRQNGVDAHEVGEIVAFSEYDIEVKK